MLEHDVHLLAAFCCEKVLEEKDGVTSIIRLIDYIQASIPTWYDDATKDEWSFTPASIEFFLSLRSFEFEGTKQILVKASHESWGGVMEIELPLTFARNQKHNYHFEIPLSTKFPGTVWIEVSLAEVTLARVPFDIEHVRTPAEPEILPDSSGPSSLHLSTWAQEPE